VVVLGGRYTLCKAVLESQPVYWLSLASILLSILHKLRKLLYNFLWNGSGDSKHYHLCRWETLARPKRFGGWGFRNIFSFSKALAATTLWRVLTKEGIWHKVIKEKYFPFITVNNWLRSVSFHQPSASKIWNNLLKSVHLITNWISWKPDMGHHVALGRDRILGLGSSSFLSLPLLTVLRQKHFSVLAQVWRNHGHDSLLSTWINNSDMDLTGNLAVEWDHYRRALQASGITLSENEDELLWIGGDSSGSLSTKNVYATLFSTLNQSTITGWRNQLWKWNIQQKIKLFLWLAVKNKILTWNNLQLRGWKGPGRCHLCKRDSEDNAHLFIHCPFTKLIWVKN
jgi:hypothetical protein